MYAKQVFLQIFPWNMKQSNGTSLEYGSSPIFITSWSQHEEWYSRSMWKQWSQVSQVSMFTVLVFLVVLTFNTIPSPSSEKIFCGQTSGLQIGATSSQSEPNWNLKSSKGCRELCRKLHELSQYCINYINELYEWIWVVNRMPYETIYLRHSETLRDTYCNLHKCSQYHPWELTDILKPSNPETGPWARTLLATLVITCNFGNHFGNRFGLPSNLFESTGKSRKQSVRRFLWLARSIS